MFNDFWNTGYFLQFIITIDKEVAEKNPSKTLNNWKKEYN